MKIISFIVASIIGFGTFLGPKMQTSDSGISGEGLALVSHMQSTLKSTAAALAESVSDKKEDEESKDSKSQDSKSDFEKAVEIIKKYESLHKPQHWPLVGYGHKVLPGEKFSRTRALGEKEADALLRKDLLKNCAVFREYGADSLLLGVLAYNIGSGAALRSSVARKLKSGDRDIKANYLAHSRYRGKVHSQIQKRRIEEFETLFIETPGHELGRTVDIPANLTHNGPISEANNIAQNSSSVHSAQPRAVSGHSQLHTINSMLACTFASQPYYWH